MRIRFKALAAVAVVGALALAGCSSSGGGSSSTGSSSHKFKVVAFTSGNQTPVGAWWVKAVTKVAADNGWDLTMIQGDFNFQKMNPEVESAIGQGCDAVFDGYTDVASIGSIVTAAKDANVPIFAMDSATSADKAFALNITTNQQDIADQTLGAMKKALGGSFAGKTIMVIGHDPHPGIRLRASLALKELQADGATIANGAIQKVQSPATGRTEALAFVADYLSAHPNGLDGVWVGWDDAALGAAKAVSEAGSKAKVTGSDAIAEAVANIQSNGPMVATDNQPWPMILDKVVTAMKAYQKDKSLPKETFIAEVPTLVDASNAATITPSDKLG